MSREPQLFGSPQKRNLVLCLLIVVAILTVYNSVNQHPFVNYDDPGYVTDNVHLHEGLSWNTVKWAVTATDQANWHPLTWMSHALDYQLFHRNPAGHHFTSVVIHAASAVFLFLALVYLTGRIGPSLFVALLFALHPINVESVAWIAERKNVLSTFFFFLAIGAYGWYARKPGWRRYLAVFVFFALGLMSKPMIVTLPFVLLLLDYWPLDRIRGWTPAGPRVAQSSLSNLALEKLPLFALSAASCVITMVAQQSGGAMRSTVQFSLGVRLENALVDYAMYLWKMLWPARLAPMYPHPGDTLAAWQVLLALVVIAGITVLILSVREKRYLLVGWLWFLGTLVPVIGLVQVGDQAMADRYAYVPLIGIFIMIAFGFADWAASIKVPTTVMMAVSACVLIALGLLTVRQIGYWSSNVELWTHTLAVTHNNFIAEDNMGGALLLLDKPDEAYAHFRAAADINASDPMSRLNLGAYLQEHNKLREAVTQYETAIRLTFDRPLLANTYANLGTAYRDLGDGPKASANYEEALRLNPEQSSAYLGRGRLRENSGKLEEAIKDYQRSLEIRPSETGYLRLGHALEALNRRPEALIAYKQALTMNPDSAEAQQAWRALSEKH